MTESKIIKISVPAISKISNGEDPVGFVETQLFFAGLNEGCEVVLDGESVVIAVSNASFHIRIFGALIGLNLTKKDISVEVEQREPSEFSKLSNYFKDRIIEGIGSVLFDLYFLENGIDGDSAVRQFTSDATSKVRTFVSDKGVLAELDESIDALAVILLRCNQSLIALEAKLSMPVVSKARNTVIKNLLESGELRELTDHKIFEQMILEETEVEAV